MAPTWAGPGLFLLGFSKNEMDILELDTHEIVSSEDVLFSSDYSVTSFFRTIDVWKGLIVSKRTQKRSQCQCDSYFKNKYRFSDSTSITTPLALCHNIICTMTSFKPGCFLQYQEWTKSMLIKVVDLEHRDYALYCRADCRYPSNDNTRDSDMTRMPELFWFVYHVSLFVSEQSKPSKEISIGAPYSFTHNVHLEIVDGKIKVCLSCFVYYKYSLRV